MSASVNLTFYNIATVGLRPEGLFGTSSAILLGSTIFHSFIGGPITYKTVPRAQFRAIQSNIFPVLFSAQTFVSGALLGLWIRLHPSVQSFSGLFDVSRPDSLTGLCLAAMTATGALNLAVVGPATTKVMNERVKQEESEGKTHDQPGISETMQKLNKQFASLHGISALTNLVFVGAGLLSQSLTSVYGI